MSEMMNKLNRISLIENLEESDYSEDLIESILDVYDEKTETAYVCNTPTELHNAIVSMSEVKE